MKKVIGVLTLMLVLVTTSCVSKDKKNIVGGTWQRVNTNGNNFNLTFSEDGTVVYAHTDYGVSSVGKWSAKATALYHLLTIENTEDIPTYISLNAEWNIIRLTPELLIISTDDFGGQITLDFVRQ